jgi:Putative Actinobacterial Holin-X, holin superfamily III
MTGSSENARSDLPSGSAELLGLFAQDLTNLLRLELELNQAEHAERRRERAIEVASLAGGIAAGLMACAALTAATIKGLEYLFSAWASCLIAAAAWGTGAVLLLLAGKLPRLLQRFDPAGDEETVERLRGECLLAQQALRASSSRLAEAAASEAVQAATQRAADTVHQEGELLLRELRSLLRAPGRAGIGMLGKLAGR